MPLRSLRLLTALLAFVLMPGLARAGGGDQTTVQVVDGYTVVLSLPPNRVQTGPNDVTVTIHAHDGPAVADASVSAAVIAYAAAGGHSDTHGEAPAGQVAAHSDDHAADGHGHEAIPTMLSPGAEAGSYQGVLHFDQAGTATVVVAFTVAGVERATLFTVLVVQARPRALVLGGFAVVNGLAIVTAAVLKRRMPQKTRSKHAVPRPPVIPLTTASASIEEERSV